MATPIVMPSFGMFTAEGSLANWLVPDGEPVNAGMAVLEIETEKSLNEVVAPAGGILRHMVNVGSLVKETELLGYVLAEGEPLPNKEASFAEAEGPESDSAFAASGSNAAQAPGFIRATPIARKLADQLGIELASIKGSGPGGRITEADVATRIQSKNSDNIIVSAAKPIPSLKRIPLSSLRRNIAKRLRYSIDTTIAVTLARDIEADHLVAARKSLSQQLGMAVPYDAYFIRVLAEALRQHPDFNRIIEKDSLVQFDSVDIGVAVAVPNGLLAPVIRDADKATIGELAKEILRLKQEGYAGKLTADQLTGGVSTVTNLGAFDVDVFTPVLNPPQCTILGVGRIIERPVVRNGAAAIAQVCWLSLTFDHRLVDGVPAAQFLSAIAKSLTDPSELSRLTS